MTVIDFKGEEVQKEEAKLIRGKWYVKWKDCLLDDGIWYTEEEEESAVRDHSTGKLQSSNYKRYLMYGLVDKGKMGYFSHDRDDLIIACAMDFKGVKSSVREIAINISSSQIPHPLGLIMNEEVAALNGFKESPLNGLYYRPKEVSGNYFAFKGCPEQYKFKNQYNVADSPGLLHDRQEQFNEKLFKPSFNMRKIWNKYIAPYSLGFEVEFSNGFVRQSFLKKYGMIGLRDGSVNNTGSELATIPIKSAAGLESFRQALDVLKEKCDVDASCSVHIHVGNTPKSKLFLICLWRVTQLLEKELFMMHPLSRQEGNGEKVYCKHLPKIGLKYDDLLTKQPEKYKEAIRREFGKIFSFINYHVPGTVYDQVRYLKLTDKGKYRVVTRSKRYSTKHKKHYQDEEPKWKVNSRYYHLSYYNLLFREQETIEWRMMEGSLSWDKISNWMLIIVAIMRYADKGRNVLSLKELSLKDVLSSIYDEETTAILISYVELRKSKFYSEELGIALNDGEWQMRDAKFKNNKSIF